MKSVKKGGGPSFLLKANQCIPCVGMENHRRGNRFEIVGTKIQLQERKAKLRSSQTEGNFGQILAITQQDTVHLDIGDKMIFKDDGFALENTARSLIVDQTGIQSDETKIMGDSFYL